MPRTDWKVLMDYPHVLPPKELLASFSALFENAVAQQQNLVSRNQTLRRTRDLLLPKLLSGDGASFRAGNPPENLEKSLRNT